MNQQQNLTIRLIRVLRYYKARTERAVSLLPPDKKPLYHIIPFLIHVNHPNFPGFVGNDKVPYGLNNYSLRPDVQKALLQVFPHHKSLIEDMKPIWPKQRFIESLLLMGSVGSIGHSSKSDFDYWVCYDKAKFDEETFELLVHKLTMIEKWAQSKGLEVHFFPSDIASVQKNDFGSAGLESSGTAQAIFLKAEFYTTNIIVAGKAPYWWLVSDKATDEDYQTLINNLADSENPDPSWFMDLGNITRMDSDELFGAAIWQISKAMDSPFKSVLKMAKLEAFLERTEEQTPLCNKLKKRVHDGALERGELENIDPYALMFDQLVAFYSAMNKPEVVSLLQTCLYVKSEAKLSRPLRESEKNFKRIIMAKYVEEWGWDKVKLERLDRIKYWGFLETAQLGKQVHAFLITCYRRISKRIERRRQVVSVEDTTVIGRKIDTFYTKKPGKIDYFRGVFEEPLFLRAISIKADIDFNAQGAKRWRAYRGKVTDWNDKDLNKLLLKVTYDPLDLMVWCVFNRIINLDTEIYSYYTCEPIKVADLKSFVEVCIEAFPYRPMSEFSRQELLLPCRIINCVCVINFEEKRHSKEAECIRTIYSTSWGEIYSFAGFEALEDLRMDIFDDIPPATTYLYAPEGSSKDKLYKSFSERANMDFEKLV